MGNVNNYFSFPTTRRTIPTTIDAAKIMPPTCTSLAEFIKNSCIAITLRTARIAKTLTRVVQVIKMKPRICFCCFIYPSVYAM